MAEATPRTGRGKFAVSGSSTDPMTTGVFSVSDVCAPVCQGPASTCGGARTTGGVALNTGLLGRIPWNFWCGRIRGWWPGTLATLLFGSQRVYREGSPSSPVNSAPCLSAALWVGVQSGEGLWTSEENSCRSRDFPSNPGDNVHRGSFVREGP